jgi:hypothetical protein
MWQDPDKRAQIIANFVIAQNQPEAIERKRAHMRDRYSSADEREAQSARMITRFENPDEIAKLSSRSKEMHARPGFKEKHKAAIKQVLTPEFCKARGEALSKAIMSSPEYLVDKAAAGRASATKRKESGSYRDVEIRAKISASLKSYMSCPDVRAMQSAKIKNALSSPEARARMSASAKEAMNRPEVKAKCTAAKKIAMARPDVRAKISAARVELLKDPEARAKLSDASKDFAARRLAFIEQSVFTGNRRTITRDQVDSWFAAHV